MQWNRAASIDQSEPSAPATSAHSLSLRMRFFLGIGLILLGFCLICAYIIYRQGRLLLESAAQSKSEIVINAVEASQNYVRDVLRPRLYQVLGHDAFVLEGMSTSFVARSVMDRFNASMPEYRFRRVAIGARNPASEANENEVQMIRRFAAHPEERDWRGTIKSGGESHFMLFRPVYFRQSCLHCHGDVDDAPKAMLELYGREKGFGRKEGDLAGVIAVGISMDVALSELKGKALSVFMSSFFFAAILFLLISSLFNRLVAHDLRKILNVFKGGLGEETDTGKTGSGEPKAMTGLGAVPTGLAWADELKHFEALHGKDEIEVITQTARGMAEKLRENRVRLEQNAEMLERTVLERTRELRESEERLRSQVIARNRELHTLNTLAELTTQSDRLSAILPDVMEQTLSLISARGAGLYLFDENGSRLHLQCSRSGEDLVGHLDFDPSICTLIHDDGSDDPLTSLREAACGHISLLDGPGKRPTLNIPLCCRGRVLGVMTFLDVDFKEVTPALHELLFSVGRQVGIAVESLQSVGKLLQSKELLQSVFDSITDMVILMDSDFRIRMVNKAYLKRYGLSEEDVLGQACNEIHRADACPFPDCGMRKAFESRQPVLEEVTTTAGEIFLMHFYPVADERGEVISMVRYARDITQQKRIEQHIQSTEKLASLGQLAAGIAHEINNPLGVILCYTDLLKRQLEDNPQASSDVATIEKHTLNCKRIVSDLLKFARGESGSRQLKAINRSIEEAVAMVSHQFSRQDIEITLNLDSELPLLNMDEDKLKQVFVNLLVNAQQAIADKGIIRIQSRFLPESNQIELRFRDNGTGIPPDIQKRIFDPFFSTKDASEGTGLGLSVSYGIVRDHQGEILVGSEPGQWTEFTILLPVSEGA
ncbi:MAG: DUF3365 domain-containing protein [Syntrophobacteraceae bacterium]